jgi:hypothetical protein
VPLSRQFLQGRVEIPDFLKRRTSSQFFFIKPGAIWLHAGVKLKSSLLESFTDIGLDHGLFERPGCPQQENWRPIVLVKWQSVLLSPCENAKEGNIKFLKDLRCVMGPSHYANLCTAEKIENHLTHMTRAVIYQ